MIAHPGTVICVPGPWKDRGELIGRISAESGGYLFASQALMHPETKEVFELEVEPRTQEWPRRFELRKVTEEDLARIGAHTFVLYLIAEGGSRARAEAARSAAAGLLRSGGLAVKIESSGLAHSKSTWLELVEKRYLLSPHRAFVVYVTGTEVYSCGMHNLGFRDAIMDANDSD